MNVKTGLFIGRFQPIHNGHMEAIRHAASKCGTLIVLVGSSQKSYEMGDPFTVGERVGMVHESLKGAGLAGKCIVLSVPDIQNNALWVAHIKSLVPPFDAVFSNNSLVKALFTDARDKVYPTPMSNRAELEGTAIRKLLLEGKDVSGLVPPEALAAMDRIKAGERLRLIAQTDRDGE